MEDTLDLVGLSWDCVFWFRGARLNLIKRGLTMLRKSVLSLAILGVVSSSAFGASDVIQGVVSNINTAAIDDTSYAGAMNNINTTAKTNLDVALITIDNNDPDGFSLTIAGAGKLVRATSGGTNAGDFLTYTVNLDNTGSTGVLGSTEPALPSAVDLSGGDSVTNFNTSVIQATVARTYELQMTTSAKDALLEGTFEDTITITVANL